jgi:hypothetical protein
MTWQRKRAATLALVLTLAFLVSSVQTVNGRPEPVPTVQRRAEENQDGSSATTSLGAGDPASQATLHEPAAHAATSSFQNSLTLDGDGDYVEVSDAPELRLSDVDGYTIEAWVRYNDTDCETIISKTYQDAYYLGVCSGKIRYWSGGTRAADSTQTVPLGEWTHIAVVWQRNGSYQYYINGEADASGSAGPAPSDTNTDPLFIGADPDPTQDASLYELNGNIAEVQLWEVARDADDIRRTMHMAMEEPRPGLISAWHLAGAFEYQDTIGNHDGTGRGDASISGPEPPSQLATVPVDRFFNTLSTPTHEAASATIPESDVGVLIGGERGGAVSDQVDLVSLDTGETNTLATLPAPREEAMAAYVPTKDTVYVFGGRDIGGNDSSAIYAVPVGLASPRTLAATLPVAEHSASAVYHPGADKVYIFGGRNSTTLQTGEIFVFDPATETIAESASGISRSDMAAAYSAATDKIYLFGGNPPGSTSIFEVTVGEEGEIISLVNLADVSMPAPVGKLPGITNGRAVEDPESNLIYLTGGGWTRFLAFDPVTHEIWPTRMELAGRRSAPSLFYSPTNRHAVLTGGADGFDVKSGVWRIPLGDGPAMPMGRWDFPRAMNAEVTAIDGDESKVAVASDGDGVRLFDENNAWTNYDSGDFGTNIVNDVRYNDVANRVWVGSDAGGHLIDLEGGGVTTYITDTTRSTDFRPFGTELNADYSYFYGTTAGLKWAVPTSSITNFSTSEIRAIAHRDLGDLWALTDGTLSRLEYDAFDGTNTETSYGRPCYNPDLDSRRYGDPDDVVLDQADNWWIAIGGAPAGGGEDIWAERGGICYIPAATTPQGENFFIPTMGDTDDSPAGSTTNAGSDATAVAVDAENRVWVSINEMEGGYDTDDRGGLVAYQAVNSTSSDVEDHVRTEEFDWLKMPLAEEGFSAVGAADERVWAGKADGTLVTLAQRWWRLDESNRMEEKNLKDVWTVRGRAFFATLTDLAVLLPDGKTWETRSVTVNDVMADQEGRIWVATDNDVRLYTPDGWDMLSDAAGTPPNGPVRALAEDGKGRVWIGSDSGLTLFDRGRFVSTFTGANSELPSEDVYALLVDGKDRLWVGTNAGLARRTAQGWRTWTTSDGLPSNIILDLATAQEGEIALSTLAPSAVTFFDGASFNTFTPPLASSSARIPLTTDGKGRLWAASSVWTGGNWESHYPTDSGLGHFDVQGVTVDGAERIWFVHGSGAGVSIRGTRLPPLADVQPSISAISPDTGSSGDIITVQGSGFGTNKDRASVTIGGAEVEITSISNSEIDVRLNDQNRSGGVSVSVDGRRVTLTNGGSRRAFCAEPVVDQFNPIGGNDGMTVDIEGSNFDADAQVALGGGSDRDVDPLASGVSHLRVGIQPGDNDGEVTVKNTCDGVTGASSIPFRYYDPAISDVVLNQGASSLFHVSDKPTMVQVYLTTDRELRSFPEGADQLAIDRVDVTFGSGTDAHTYSVPYRRSGLPSHAGGPSAADLKAIDESLHVQVTPRIEDLLDAAGGTPQVTVRLRNESDVAGAYTVAQKTIEGPETFFAPNMPMHVLLVPIMSNHSGSADVNQLKNNVNGQLQHLHERIWPTGRVETHWSSMSFTVREALAGDRSEIDIGNFLQLYHASHNLEKARQAYNANHDPDAIIALGVVEGEVATGAGGKAFWPNVSRLMDVVALEKLDTLCDAGNAVVRLVTLGAAGSEDGCHLEIPIYVGWADASVPAPSETFGHEMGHTMGLVGLAASNSGALSPFPAEKNITHSANDEIEGGETSELGAGTASYDRDRTFYVQPGVEEPIVDPIGGRQLRPRLGDVVTGSIDGNTVSSGALVARAKAIMSYAAQRNNDNVLFEPVDILQVYREQGLASATQFIRNLDNGVASSAATSSPMAPERAAEAPTPKPVAGERLFISGIINRTTMTGTLEQVETAGETVPLSPGFDTGYTLVQLEADGAELDELGIFPVFRTPGDEAEHDVGFFDATLLLQDGVSRVQLRSGDTVLDSFSAGSAAPTISLSSPSGGGSYATGSVPVAWSASDPDGDPVQIAIEYSDDNGSTWTTMAFAEGSDSVDLPVGQLGGSSQARVRITADDGFHKSSATSDAFSVAEQPPRPFIGAPAPGDTFLEGERIQLRGGADDNQDGTVTGGKLRWRSDRDGALGTGQELATVLRVGQHTVTLEAENSAGLTATTQVSVTIRGDYDYDGIPDGEELSAGMNPLAEGDARTDRDGDGLSRIVERKRGTDPAVADTDGDGRNDGQEVADGTDPTTMDDPPKADALQVVPDRLTFTADLSRDIPLPQQQVEVLSRSPVSWTLSADVGWLSASSAAGRTPAGPTILVDAFELEDGTHSGTLTFESAELGSSIDVPVEITVTQSAGHFDVNEDEGVNIGDVQRVAGDIPSNNTQAAFDYRQDIDRDGDVDVQDATRTAQRWESDHVCCPVSYPGSTASVRLVPPASLSAGQVVTVPIEITNSRALGGFEVTVSYDPSILQLKNAALGGFLRDTGRSTSSLGAISEGGDQVAFGGYSHGSQAGATGNGQLGVLTFDVLGDGESDLTLENVLLASPAGNVTRPGAEIGRQIYIPVVLRRR